MATVVRNKIIVSTLVIFFAIVLGLFTVTQWLNVKGMYYLENRQTNRYNDILAGHAGNPWQYRILAPYLIKGVNALFEYDHISQPLPSAFIALRFIQDSLIFVLLYIYIRNFGLSLPNALLGMAIMAWGVSYSLYDSDFSFNVFFDIIFYLLAGICIIKRKYYWIIPITLLAALNRETSGLIPFILLGFVLVLDRASIRKVLPIFAISMLVYLIIFVGLRIFFGKQALLEPYYHKFGLDLLTYNIFRLVSWRQEVATLSIIPIISIIGYKKWSFQLKIIFWVIVPIWFVIHLLGAVMAEARLFLVPQAMAFIPGALFSLNQTQTQVNNSQST